MGDIIALLEIARFALKEMPYAVSNDLDLSDAEIERLLNEVTSFLEGK